MPITGKSVQVLRFWYRISLMPCVQALSCPARWWLYGVVNEWTGQNNGAIEFTRAVHGSQFGLGHPAVFDRARRAVLTTGLVMRSRVGGRNLRDQYVIVILPVQVPVGLRLGTPRVPTGSEILGTPRVLTELKTGTRRVPSWYTSRTKESDPHKRNARASEYAKRKPLASTERLTDSDYARLKGDRHRRGGNT
jgi:hypothetical protein